MDQQQQQQQLQQQQEEGCCKRWNNTQPPPKGAVVRCIDCICNCSNSHCYETPDEDDKEEKDSAFQILTQVPENNVDESTHVGYHNHTCCV